MASYVSSCFFDVFKHLSTGHTITNDMLLTIRYSERLYYTAVKQPSDDDQHIARRCAWATLCPILSGMLLIALLLTVILLLCPWLLVGCTFEAAQVPEIIEDYTPRLISFSSCMGNWVDHSLMHRIDSDVYIFLGDSIYGDDYSYEFEDRKPSWLSFLKLPAHMALYYQLMYRKLSCRHSFKRLFLRVPYVLSIWDDHDYGSDDETSSNPMKHHARQMFQEFWNLNAQRRRRVGGVYGSYEFRNARGRSVLIVLPDLHYSTNPTRLFDAQQWGWLTSLLTRHAHATIIVGMSTPISGLQSTYPHEIDTLLSMLNPSTSVIISGDPHVPRLAYLPSGHMDITSSPLAMVGSAPAQHAICHTNCTIDKNQDNYGLIDLQASVGFIMSAHGPLLQAKIFA
jgi:hypothetical protein